MFFRFSLIVFMGFRWCFLCFFGENGAFWGSFKAFLRGHKGAF
ncbi:hypothetical protein HMPREF1860_01042 [Prevotella amnii]|uniref:Uncharacterized protein n=1 Tax=Prevotella amnii TaxID=419005 RepID=A0A134BDP7_9BACT|nr:hypothetical protein HMPREF1860_01042 [Prevotella amnii]